ncbi:MAG: type I pullulanase [Clostridia bacterium]|nr:type I pullulanase [Clostridia bacterium]
MADKKTPAQLRRWFDSAEFRDLYHTDAPLGVELEEETTVFRLWAPTAEKVTLNLYPMGDGCDATLSVPMEPGKKGVWACRLETNLEGVYYDYDVTVDGVLYANTQDPYARSAGLNGKRSMVVDMAEANPTLWPEDKAPARAAEDVIYEIHVKDFSWDACSGVPEEHRGLYTALTLEETTLDGKGKVPTCLNHARKLGATHIQLMPVYDYGSVEEGAAKDDPDVFNWGYDPVNYNVPEGSYASDPKDGYARIRELKEAIQAMHRMGFRVIMDVVYNHTFQLKENCLFRSVPWYFFRQNEDGSASNGSGCGTEIASERSMVSRYILDSVLYWAEEYHIDGFRFDLMGMLDVPLMNRIQEALDKRFGKGEKQLWGEPWAGGTCHPIAGTELAHKGNMRRLDASIAAFCDDTRDSVKGSVMDEKSVGFVNGGGVPADRLARCLRGWAGDNGDFAAPSQTITYLSSHDDWTLWDKLITTLDADAKDYNGRPEKVLAANRMAFAILSCCQGHLFMLSGEEFGRTKQGVKNSYKSPLDINCMDWQRCADNADLVEYYRGFIALRKQLAGACDKSAEAGRRVLFMRQVNRDAAALLLKNGDNEKWPRVVLAVNASQEAVTVSLPEGEWAILADGLRSDLWKMPETIIRRVSVPPMTAMILGEAK